MIYGDIVLTIYVKLPKKVEPGWTGFSENAVK